VSFGFKPELLQLQPDSASARIEQVLNFFRLRRLTQIEQGPGKIILAWYFDHNSVNNRTVVISSFSINSLAYDDAFCAATITVLIKREKITTVRLCLWLSLTV